MSSLHEAASEVALTSDAASVSASQGPRLTPVRNSSQLSKRQAEDLLGRCDAHIGRGRIVAYGLTGSTLYNLHTPSSDRDTTIITDVKSKKDWHRVFDDGEDVRVVSVHSFASRILNSQPTDVDFLMSGALTFDTSPYEAYLRLLHFDTNAYLDRCESHSIEYIKKAAGDENNRRRHKSLKTAFRNAVTFNRVRRDGTRYTSWFNEGQRIRFYDHLDGIYTNFEAHGRGQRPARVFEMLLEVAEDVDGA